MLEMEVSPDIRNVVNSLLEVDKEKFDKCLKIIEALINENQMAINFTRTGMGMKIDKNALENFSKEHKIEFKEVFSIANQVSMLLDYLLKDINAKGHLENLFKKDKTKLKGILNLITDKIRNRFYFQISAKGNYFSTMVWEINRKEYPREDIKPIKTASLQINVIDGQTGNTHPLIFECSPQDVKMMIDYLQKLSSRFGEK